MKIFIAGATGYIGSAVAARLMQAGHAVTGLARSDQAVHKLQQHGYKVHRGDLLEPDTLIPAVQNADVIINVAQLPFDPQGDFVSQMTQLGEATLAATKTVLTAISGAGKIFLTTGGTGAYGDTGDAIATEETPILNMPFLAAMGEAEQFVLKAEGTKGMTIRPGIVYGYDGGPVSHLLPVVRQFNAALYSGDGENQLSFVHLDDLADLYLLMIEKAQSGLLLNGVAEPFVTQKQVMRAVSRVAGLEGETNPMPPEMQQRAGGYSIFSRNMQVSGAKARSLGWTPSRPSVVEDIEHAAHPA